MRYVTRVGIAAAGVAAAGLLLATAATADNPDIEHAALRSEIQQLLQARHDRGAEREHGPSTPLVIPRDAFDADATGRIETYQPAGATITKDNAFFQDLGVRAISC